MAPDEIDHARDQHDSNHSIELVEVLAEFAPVFAELHSKIGEGQAPRPRSEKRVEVKAEARHARNARRQSDEGADHRQQPPDEDSQISPAMKESVGPVEFAAAHENPAAVALDQRTS